MVAFIEDVVWTHVFHSIRWDCGHTLYLITNVFELIIIQLQKREFTMEGYSVCNKGNLGREDNGCK